MPIQIEVLCAECNRLGENPLWDVAEQRLYWIDSLGRAVHSSDAAGKNRKRWPVPREVGSMALREDGGAIVALHDGFYALDFATGDASLIVKVYDADMSVRFNDGKVDRQGRFVAGSMHREQRDSVGSLFRVDTDWSVHALDTGIILSNGPCFSPDGTRLYFADTVARRIYAYEYDCGTGNALTREIFADFKDLGLHGVPDGATVDEEGYVWCVEAARGRLIRFDGDGVIDRIVGLPVEDATSIAFGGADLDIAFVTSIGRPLKGRRRREREAGFVFAIYGLGVRGIPERRFDG